MLKIFSKRYLYILLTLSFAVHSNAKLSTKDFSDDRIDLSKYVASHVALLDSDRKPVCILKISGDSSLVPKFLKAAPEGFESRFTNSDIEPCNSDEGSLISSLAKKSYTEIKTAGAPVVLAAGAALCVITGGPMAAYGSLERLGKESAKDATHTTKNIGLGIGFGHAVATSGGLSAAGMAATVGGATVGMVCGAIGGALGYFGMDFILDLE